MKILTDPNLYVELQTWAEGILDAYGYETAYEVQSRIDAEKKKLETKTSRTFKDEERLERLEDLAVMLSRAIARKSMLDFTAPGREAIKMVRCDKENKKKGGKNSHGMTAEEREIRNAQIQNEIDRLCSKGQSYSNAQKITGQKFGLHPDTVRTITKNPRK